ncbi:MAG TPA: response regulator [Methylomirabilota bacterium]|nr:response regulator [Methylomirabilota bacterium]
MQKVLVVDDSLSVRKLVEKALEGRGLQVIAAASGAEAIQMLERDRPDVVICDVILPDKDGYQICQYVRTHPAIAATPVLLISGIDNGTVQARAAEVRSDEVMFKPFGVDDLLSKINSLLSRRVNGAKRESVAPPAVAPVSSASVPQVTAGPAPAPPSAPSAAAVSVPTQSAPASVSAPAPEPASVAAAPAASEQGLKQRLQAIAGTPGVRFVVLTDREGFLIETAGDLAPDVDEVTGALASCLAEASDGIGRELGQGQLVGTILEYESGILLLHGVGPSALLAVLVGDQGALGKVRYYVRKTVPELVRAL